MQCAGNIAHHHYVIWCACRLSLSRKPWRSCHWCCFSGLADVGQSLWCPCLFCFLLFVFALWYWISGDYFWLKFWPCPFFGRLLPFFSDWTDLDRTAPILVFLPILHRPRLRCRRRMIIFDKTWLKGCVHHWERRQADSYRNLNCTYSYPMQLCHDMVGKAYGNSVDEDLPVEVKSGMNDVFMGKGDWYLEDIPFSKGSEDLASLCSGFEASQSQSVAMPWVEYISSQQSWYYFWASIAQSWRATSVGWD